MKNENKKRGVIQVSNFTNIFIPICDINCKFSNTGSSSSNWIKNNIMIYDLISHFNVKKGIFRCLFILGKIIKKENEIYSRAFVKILNSLLKNNTSSGKSNSLFLITSIFFNRVTLVRVESYINSEISSLNKMAGFAN